MVKPSSLLVLWS